MAAPAGPSGPEKTTRARRPARVVAALGLAVGLVIGVAACGRSSGDSDGIASAVGAAPTTAAPAGAADGTYDAVGWAGCLREHGIPTDDPTAPGEKPVTHDEGMDPALVRQAGEACRKFNPNFGRPAPPTTPEELEQARQYARCMRANGVDLPDPQPGTDDSRAELPTGDTVPGEVFERADAACRSKVPGMPPPPSGAPGGKQ